MNKDLTDERLSLLLLCSAMLLFIASMTVLYRCSNGFSESLLETESEKRTLAVLWASVMLMVANFVYQLIIRSAMPFSRRMLIGYLVCEMLYSGFLFALKM